jgi:hypothetical protein
MSLYFVLYRSKATKPLNEATIIDIVAKSMRNNPRDGLTGFLHTEDNHFLQFLEGPRDPLMRKIAKIRKDRRHMNFIILADGEIDERFFPEWGIGRLPEEVTEIMGKDWMFPSPAVNPLPLLQAFAEYAGHAHITQITPAN